MSSVEVAVLAAADGIRLDKGGPESPSCRQLDSAVVLEEDAPVPVAGQAGCDDPFDIVYNLPSEVGLRIAFWMLPPTLNDDAGPRDLFLFGSLSRYYNMLASDEYVWREAYKRLLWGKQWTPHSPPPTQLHHLCCFTGREHLLERMTDHELRVFCIERHNRRLVVIPDVPFGIPLPEDPDASSNSSRPSSTSARPSHRFLASDLRPSDSVDSFFLPTDITNVPSVISHLDRPALLALAQTKLFLSPAIPQDVRFASKYQLSYATALRDAKRIFITEHELVNMRWSVRFRDSTWFGWGNGGRVWARHERGGKMQLGDMLFHWRFLGDPDTDVIRPPPSSMFSSSMSRNNPASGYMSAERAKWKNEDVLNRRRLVQCERYAPKTVRRTADWGWTLKNPNVKYTSLNQDLAAQGIPVGPMGLPLPAAAATTGAATLPAPSSSSSSSSTTLPPNNGTSSSSSSSLPTIPSLANAPNLVDANMAQQLIHILTSPFGAQFITYGGGFMGGAGHHHNHHHHDHDHDHDEEEEEEDQEQVEEEEQEEEEEEEIGDEGEESELSDMERDDDENRILQEHRWLSNGNFMD